MSVVVAEGVVKVTADSKAVGDDLTRDISKSGSAAAGAGGKLGRSIFGGVIGAYAAMGVTQKVTGWIGDAIMAGSNYNETMSKGAAIFGTQMGAVEKWASTSATSVGLSKEAATSAAASFGDMFSQIGFTGKEAANMSTKVVQAAADLGSFSNLDTADVSERISAAFRGEYDSLQAVIPNISAARVEQEAMARSGKTNASALTAQEKASAVLAIVQKDGNRAMGDFARTSGGFANQMKIAAAQSDDLKGRIGGALQPALQAGAGVLTGVLMPALLGFADKAAPAISSAVDGISGVLGGLGGKLGPVFGSVGQIFAPIFEAFQPLLSIGLQLWQALSPVSLIFSALSQAGAPVMIAFQGIAIALGDGLVSALSAVLPAVQQLAAVFSGALATVIPMLVPIITQLMSAFMTLAPVVGQILAAILPLATSLIGMLVPIIMQLVSAVLPPLISIFGMVVPAIMPLVQAILGILIPVIRLLMPVIQAVFSAIVPIITAAMQIIKGVIQVVTGIITGNWSQVWSGIKNILAGVWNAIKAIVLGALNILRAVIVAGLGIIKGVFSAVWNAIKAVVSAAINGLVNIARAQFNILRSVITTVSNFVRTAISAGFNAARGAVSAVVNAIVGFVRNMASGVGSAIDSAVGFFRGLGGKISSAVSGFGSLLVSVGKNVIQGFINGAKSMAGSILSAVTSPIKNAINGAKSLLGIHSPSRVFRDIGINVGRGLEQGLNGSVKGVKSATRTLTNALINEFDRENGVRNKARATIAALSDGNNPLRKTAAGRAKIAAGIAAANRLIAAQPLTTSKFNAAMATVQRGSKLMQTFASRQDKYSDRIKAATKSLAAAQKQQSDYQKSVASNLQKLDITKIATGVGGSNIVAALQAQLKDTKAFTATLTKLRKAGLDNTSLQQFISAGVDALPQAQELLAGGSSRIKQVASLQKQLGTATSSFAATSAKELYGAGVNAAKGLVNGLKSQQKALDRQMKSLATSLTRTIKKQLGIHSPSRVFRDEVGAMLGQGVAVGFSMEKNGIVRAVRGTIADAMPTSSAMRTQGMGVAAAQPTSIDSSRKIEKVVINEARDPLGTLGRLSYAWDTIGRTA